MFRSKQLRQPADWEHLKVSILVLVDVPLEAMPAMRQATNILNEVSILVLVDVPLEDRLLE